jgi:hypothetical protein
MVFFSVSIPIHVNRSERVLLSELHLDVLSGFAFGVFFLMREERERLVMRQIQAWADT